MAIHGDRIEGESASAVAVHHPRVLAKSSTTAVAQCQSILQQPLEQASRRSWFFFHGRVEDHSSTHNFRNCRRAVVNEGLVNPPTSA
jgi:hypothetical protein